MLTNLGICFACFGGMDKALELMQAAVAFDPRNARYRWNLGELLRRMGRLADAEAEIRVALALSGDAPEILCVLALILVPQGRFEEAMAAYSAAAERGLPAEGHLRVGLALADQGRLNEAESCFRAALAIDPSYAPAQEALARLQSPRR